MHHSASMIWYPLKSFGIYLRTVSQEILRISITSKRLKIMQSKLHPQPLGRNEWSLQCVVSESLFFYHSSLLMFLHTRMWTWWTVHEPHMVRCYVIFITKALRCCSLPQIRWSVCIPPPFHMKLPNVFIIRSCRTSIIQIPIEWCV